MNKFSSFIVVCLAILGGVFLVLTVFFAVSDNSSPSTSGALLDDVEVKAEVADVSDYIGAPFEKGFIGGCIDGGEGNVTESECQCMFDYLDTHMTNAELKQFAIMENMEEHPMFNKVLNNCY